MGLRAKLAAAALSGVAGVGTAQTSYDEHARPIIQNYCAARCHSAAAHLGGVVLDRYEVSLHGRDTVGSWTYVLRIIADGVMPPGALARPNADETATLLAWEANGFAQTPSDAVSLTFPVERREPLMLPFPALRAKIARVIADAEGSPAPLAVLDQLRTTLAPNDKISRATYAALGAVMRGVCDDPAVRWTYGGRVGYRALVATLFGREADASDWEVYDGVGGDFRLACLASGMRLEALSQIVPGAGDAAAAPLVRYMRELSVFVAGRDLTAQEEEELAAEPGTAARTMLERWTRRRHFVAASRDFLEKKLIAPVGDLMEEIVTRDLPYADVLRRCESVDGSRGFCDAGAPFSAGVLTMRSVLRQHAGRFNLSRASLLMREFLCREYPLLESFEPKLPRERLIPMFRAASGSNDFGNGAACYTCHGQFAPHAQLFVKFDRDGYYAPFASGQQAPGMEPGSSYAGLFTSHLAVPAEASSQASQMRGVAVPNLRGATDVLTQDPAFAQCAVREVLRYFLRLDGVAASAIKPRLVADIAASMTAPGHEPTFGEIAAAALSHPAVVEAVAGR